MKSDRLTGIWLVFLLTVLLGMAGYAAWQAQQRSSAFLKKAEYVVKICYENSVSLLEDGERKEYWALSGDRKMGTSEDLIRSVLHEDGAAWDAGSDSTGTYWSASIEAVSGGDGGSDGDGGYVLHLEDGADADREQRQVMQAAGAALYEEWSRGHVISSLFEKDLPFSAMCRDGVWIVECGGKLLRWSVPEKSFQELMDCPSGGRFAYVWTGGASA